MTVIYAVQSCTYTVHVLTCITLYVGLLSPDKMSLRMRVYICSNEWQLNFTSMFTCSYEMMMIVIVFMHFVYTYCMYMHILCDSTQAIFLLKAMSVRLVFDNARKLAHKELESECVCQNNCCSQFPDQMYSIKL